MSSIESKGQIPAEELKKHYKHGSQNIYEEVDQAYRDGYNEGIEEGAKIAAEYLRAIGLWLPEPLPIPGGQLVTHIGPILFCRKQSVNLPA